MKERPQPFGASAGLARHGGQAHRPQHIPDVAVVMLDPEVRVDHLRGLLAVLQQRDGSPPSPLPASGGPPSPPVGSGLRLSVSWKPPSSLIERDFDKARQLTLEKRTSIGERPPRKNACARTMAAHHCYTARTGCGTPGDIRFADLNSGSCFRRKSPAANQADLSKRLPP